LVSKAVIVFETLTLVVPLETLYKLLMGLLMK